MRLASGPLHQRRIDIVLHGRDLAVPYFEKVGKVGVLGFAGRLVGPRIGAEGGDAITVFEEGMDLGTRSSKAHG
jgi:hypothetical protein